MNFLKQSTSQVIRFGPFLDSTDGVTAETALTIAQADMQLSKDGAAFAQKNAAGNATHDTDGWYSTTLDATDTATVGILILQVNVSGALPVWHEYYVIEESIYDSLFAASAAGFDSNQRVNVGQWLSNAVTFGTGGPDVNINAISDDTTAATNCEAFFDGTGYAGTGNTIPTVTTVTNQVTADMTAISGDSVAADNCELFFDNTGFAASNSTIGTCTTNTDMITTTAVADAVWDEATVGHTTAGTFGEQCSTDIDAILVDTNELQGDWVDGGRLDLILDARASQATADAIETDTQDIQSRVPAALVSGRMDSNVSAINDDNEAALDLAASAATIVRATAQTGTLSTTQMTTNLSESTDDHYNGRIIIWTSGVLADQATNITDYAGSTGLLTFTAVTEAPGNGDTFVIV